MQDFLTNLEVKGHDYYLEKPVGDPFEQTGMLPYQNYSEVADATRELNTPLLFVNPDQQRQTLLELGLYDINSMIFYDCSRNEEAEMEFSIGKVVAINREEKLLEIEKYQVERTRTQKGKQRKCYQSAQKPTEFVSFARTMGIQFQLNAANQDIPQNTLKKLEQHL